MKQIIITLTTLTVIIFGCSKDNVISTGANQVANQDNFIASKPPDPRSDTLPSAVSEKAILIDASRDGGVWWFPQSSQTGFLQANSHQGENLENYLKSLGFEVNTLPRGRVITNDILDKYSNVIRAGGYGSYSENELLAYQSFLNRPTSLLLLTDHLTYFPNDLLSAQLGLQFVGPCQGPITSFASHSITTGVSFLPYIAGSVINSPYPSNVVMLGSLQIPVAGGEIISVGTMGILNHPTSRIFFMGDMNGIETVPQPLTSNLANWLFR